MNCNVTGIFFVQVFVYIMVLKLSVISLVMVYFFSVIEV